MKKTVVFLSILLLLSYSVNCFAVSDNYTEQGLVVLNSVSKTMEGSEKDSFLLQLKNDEADLYNSLCPSADSDNTTVIQLDQDKYIVRTETSHEYYSGTQKYTDRTLIIMSVESYQYDTSGSVSGMSYGIASSCTVYYTVREDYPLLDASPDYRFNSISAISTALPTATTTVSQMDYSVRMSHPVGYDVYFAPFTVYYPTSGLAYQNNLNSGFIDKLACSASVEMTMYYTNGQSYSVLNYLFV